MTPESGVMLALVITISICGAFTACVCCMCCCVASVWNAMIEKIFGRKSPIFGNSHYESMVPGVSSRYQDAGYSAGQATQEAVYAGTASYIQQNEEVPIVEAYVVPPLAAPRGASSDAHSLVYGSVEDGTSSAVSRPPVTPGAKDLWAGALFIINIIIIFSLAVQSISTFNIKSASSSSDNGQDGFDLGKTGINFPMLSLYLTMTLLLISAAGSYLVYFFLNHGENIIDWVMKLNIIGLVVLAVLSLVTLEVIGAVIFGVMAGINLWYYYSVRNRIPFASSILAAACTAVKSNFTGLLLTSFAGLMFQGLWMLLWAIALFGVYTKLSANNSSSDTNTAPSNATHNNGGDDESNNDGSAAASAVSFFMLFSLYWGLQLIKDVVAVTAGGTVATWWFQPKHPAPVRGSLFRATTTSFGSICFGSMLLAIITTLRVIVKNAVDQSRRQGRNRNGNNNFVRTCLLLILESMLKCLENILRYINKYAYSYVAAYGYDFVTAGRSVLQLFEYRGWATIINDDLISNALFLFAFFMAIIGVFVGLFLTMVLMTFHSDVLAGVPLDSVYVFGGVYGGLVGLVVGLLVISILDSAVAMVYVCFAEDSSTLQAHHPETFRDLSSKWSLFQPPMSPLGSNDDLQAHQQQQQEGMLMTPMGASANVAPYHLHGAHHAGPPQQQHTHHYLPHQPYQQATLPHTQPTVIAATNPYYVAPTASTVKTLPEATATIARPPPVNPNFHPGAPSVSSASSLYPYQQHQQQHQHQHQNGYY